MSHRRTIVSALIVSSRALAIALACVLALLPLAAVGSPACCPPPARLMPPRDAGPGPWVKTEVSRTTYVDGVQADARPHVVVENLIDYSSTPRWTREETRLDSKGRPVEVRVRTTAWGPDAVTTYDYDHRGAMVAVTLPDPSVDAWTVASVTYTYGYDGLGRPTSMRRPAITGAASGVDMSYDGLTTTTVEVAGGEGGPEAKKVLVNDAWGRLTEVREYTSLAGSGTYAATHYAYDARDQVRRIENPDGVVTELFQDWLGRRVRIERAGRVWAYGYDGHGNLRWDRMPTPDPTDLSWDAGDAEYTTIYTYDDADRPLTRAVAPRGTSATDRADLGIGAIAFDYDDCPNGIGRLCGVVMPNDRLTTTYAYDAEGNEVSRSRRVHVAGIDDTRVTTTTFGPGGRVVEHAHADHAVGQPGTVTRTYLDYDDRGLPRQMWWKPAGAPTWTQGMVANQQRNIAGQVWMRSANFGGLGPGWHSFESEWAYDPLNRILAQTIKDRHVPGLPLAQQVLEYHGLDDPKTLHHQLGSLTYDFTFDFDPRHQLTTVSEGQGRFAASYGFTASGKLASAQVSSPGLPGGEVLSRDVTYEYLSGIDPEAPSALKVAGSPNLRSYSYDNVGNLLDRREGDPDPTVPPTDEFVYDGEDQLRRARRYSAGVLTGVEEYFYDHEGHRYAVVTRDATLTATKVRLFHGDTELELDPATGAVDKAFAYLSLGTPVGKLISPAGGWAPGADYTDPATFERQYHGLANNTLASVRPDGTLQAGFVYAPYGEVIESLGTSGGLESQRRRFNDKHRDDQTGLQYYGVRYYDNVMLGWTQADPLFRFAPDAAWIEPRRASLYLFSLSNPLRYVDPDGRNPLAPAAAPVASAYAAAAGIVFLANPEAGREMARTGVRALGEVKDALDAVGHFGSLDGSMLPGELSGRVVIMAQIGAISGMMADAQASAAAAQLTDAAGGGEPPCGSGRKRGPKTDPAAPHNAKIREEGAKLVAAGHEIIAGGGIKPEKLVPTPGGKRSGRRPDIIYETNTGERRGINVGCTEADGVTPVKREREARADLIDAGLPTDFIPYM